MLLSLFWKPVNIIAKICYTIFYNYKWFFSLNYNVSVTNMHSYQDNKNVLKHSIGCKIINLLIYKYIFYPYWNKDRKANIYKLKAKYTIRNWNYLEKDGSRIKFPSHYYEVAMLSYFSGFKFAIWLSQIENKSTKILLEFLSSLWTYIYILSLMTLCFMYRKSVII